jgi:hypothetical protein
MGTIVIGFCKHCNFKSPELYSGGGKSKSSGYWHLLLDKKQKEIFTFNDRKNYLSNPNISKYENPLPGDKISDNMYKYFFDPEASKFSTLTKLKKYISRIIHIRFKHHQKHRCPSCFKYSLKFENHGFFD